MLLFWLKPWSSLFYKEELTQAEVQTAVQSQYTGEIVNITHNNGVYVVEMQMEKGKYELQMDSVSGDIISLKQTEEIEPKEQLLSKEQAEELVLNHKKGEVDLLELTKEQDKSVYKAVVVHGNEQTIMTIDAIQGDILSSKTEVIREISKIITEKEAGVIATQYVNGGQVDDIDLKETNSHSYYLVEVEFNDDREATVQVNAISGEVMSVTWDD